MNKTKGIVLFTQRVEYIESYKERRDCADQRISKFISECGYVPVPLPNSVDLLRTLLCVLDIDGVILTGGNSLVKYGGDAPERDEVDFELIKYCVENRIPLYGFCRGMQSILDYFGNELCDVKKHVAVRHRILSDDSELYVNSFHNQASVSLQNDFLMAEYVSDDGVIESVIHKDLSIMGTMWHPEREEPFSRYDINRVKDLFGGKR